jgi:antibiotic biosynthesis monooxygenase (ABM) superfamily enzyme
MIERHITFNVHPDKTADFERFFADEYAPAMAQSPGFVRVELLREAGDATRYQMTFRFQDADAGAGWRTSPVHQALQPALTALFSTNEIQGYDVIA